MTQHIIETHMTKDYPAHGIAIQSAICSTTELKQHKHEYCTRVHLDARGKYLHRIHITVTIIYSSQM